MEEKEDINIALLIDSDNVSAKYIANILSLLSKYGKITIRRMYGDWSQDRLRPWLHCSAAYSLEPIMQMNNTPGKNASDIGLIIDAMDILYRNTVGGFCICSSDGDFNKLAKRLREAGKMVIGMGERKTPEAFRASCERFIFLDVDGGEEGDEEIASSKRGRNTRRQAQSSGRTSSHTRKTGAAAASAAGAGTSYSTGYGAQTAFAAGGSNGAASAAAGAGSGATGAAAGNGAAGGGSASGSTGFAPGDLHARGDYYPSYQPDLSVDEEAGYDTDNDGEPGRSFTSRREIEKAILQMVTDNSAEGKDTTLGEIGQRLMIIFPDFDVQNYGYSKLINFIKDFSSLSVTSHDSAQWVSLNGTSDSDIEAAIHAIYAKHKTTELDLGLLKDELSQMVPNLNATIRKSGVTRFNVYLNRNIHSVQVDGSIVTLLS